MLSAQTNHQGTRAAVCRQKYVDLLSENIAVCYMEGNRNTGLFISPSGISELDCATSKTDSTERSISIDKESLKASFVLGALAYLQVPTLGGSRDEKWRAQ